MTARTPLRPGDPLPEEWRWMRLGDLFDVQQGASMSPKRRLGRSPKPFLRTRNVLWGAVDISNVDEMDFTDEEVEKLRLQPGDLLVCEGGDVGRTALWEGQLPLALYQNHIHRLRAKNSSVEPRFIMYWMQAAYRIFLAYRGAESRTAIPNLSGRRLKEFLAPLPPLETQRRIVAWLNEAFSHLQAIKERHAEAEREAAALLPAKLAEVFGRAEKEGWRWVKLGEVVEQRRQQVKPSDLDGPLNYIGLEHIEPHTGRLASFEPTEAEKLKSTKAVFKKGDLLYGKLRPYLNKVWLAEFDGISSTDIIALAPMADRAMGRFLGYILRSSPILREVKDRMTGTRMPRIRPQQLLGIGIPLPPLETQRRIVEEIEAFEEEARRIQKAQEESRVLLEQLEKSLLAEAFRPERWV